MTNNILQSKLKDLIDNHTMSIYQIIIVALCFVLNMNDGIDVLTVSFTGSEIMKEWGLSNTQLGAIFSAGLAGMTAGAIFLAPFGDKIGRRKVFLISLSLITSGMLGIYVAGAYWQVLVCRILTGLGIGGILPTMAAATSEFSNNKTRDFNVGLIQGGWPLGAIFTGFFINAMMPDHGWRFIFLVAGLVSLAMLIAVYVFMPDSLAFLSRDYSQKSQDEINHLLKKMGHPPVSEKNFQTLKAVPTANSQYSTPKIQNPTWKDLFQPEYKASTLRLWAGIFFGFLTLYTLMSWVPNIAKVAGLPAEQATYVGIALNLGAFVGVVAMGLFISKFGIRKVMLGFMLIAFAIMIAYANLSLSFGLMFGLIFFIGFFVQGGFNAFFPAATRIYPSEVRSTGVGIAFGVGRFGAILGPQIFGILRDWGMSIPMLFTLFSLPLLVTAFMAYTIPSKNLS